MSRRCCGTWSLSGCHARPNIVEHPTSCRNAPLVHRRDVPLGLEGFLLRREVEQLALTPGFERLITLHHKTIKEMPHQIDVALRVLRQMRGRAILADEVELGRTI